MGKQSNTVASPGIRRGQWTPQEDKKLFAFVQQHGHGSWHSLPQKAGGSFGKVDVEGVLTNCDQSEAPRTSTSVLGFDEVLGESGTNNEYDDLLEASLIQHNHNSTGFEVGDAWSLEHCATVMMKEQGTKYL
nr:MYB transcription factor protein [Rosa persica]